MHSSLTIAALALASACSSQLSLDGRPCPCAPGKACVVAENTCITYEREASGSAAPRCERDVAECPIPEEYIVQSFESAADVKRHLVGRWLWCGAERFDEVGIEFAED